MTSKDNIIFYTITAIVFIGIVVCSLLFHNAGQPTNGDSDRENISTIITAVSPFLTAAATIVLVGITWWYVRLTQEILKATNKPQVILYLHYDSRDVSLCVENIGTGYASDVNFDGSLLSFKQMRLDGLTLEELEPFKSGINYLGSGYKIETYLFSSGQLSSIEKKPYNIVANYKDSTNTPEEEKFTFEFGNWANTSQFVSPQKDDASDRLNRIARAIENLRDNRDNDFLRSIQIGEFLKKLERIADLLEKKILK